MSMVQVLYYFNNSRNIIDYASNLVTEEGQLIIVHQTEKGIPEIQKQHMQDLKGNTDECLTTIEIKQQLDAQNYRYHYHHLNAHLDITSCYDATDSGLKILSFCLECDLQQLHPSKLTPLFNSVQNKAIQHDKAWLLYEPVGVLILDKQIKTASINQLIKDTDPVADYRQLAHGFDWQTLFIETQNSDNKRLLDVACGTGRWLQTFTDYLGEKIADSHPNQIHYDLLDYSESALLQTRDKIRVPFQLGKHYVSSIQTVELEANCYDIIWSMHGFYAMPRLDLKFILKKLSSALKQTGQIFIAQASRDSFYVEFYTKYLEIFKQGKGTPFVSAQDITQHLEELGIEYQVKVIPYHEKIKQDDMQAIEHYILNEATINCFSEEDTSTTANHSKSIQLDSLFSHPDMASYLQSMCHSSHYHFLEEVWLISFTKL
jgi:ubiquinone/menaquinone biosynthesis C-methylase UbiE